jgi:DNA-binding CsgD family transcriptional regulator
MTLSATPSFEQVLQETRVALKASARVVGRSELTCQPAPTTAACAQMSLDAAIEAVSVVATATSSATSADSLTLLLSELGSLNLWFRTFELERRNEAMSFLGNALGELRSVNTVDELIERVPRAVVRLGYSNALFSWVDHGRWVPHSACMRSGPKDADALVEAGAPYRHIRNLVEVSVVRNRQAILVRDAHRTPGVHEALLAITESDSYVAAPLVSNGQVVGFLHADEHHETGSLDHFDRDLIATFTEGFGFAYDRARLVSKLSRVVSGVGQQAAALEDLMGDLGHRLPAQGLHGAECGDALDVSTDLGRLDAGSWAADLTRREVQILSLVATGSTNGQIAERLYVAEGTVKSHVKNVLRKLGAANRAEAGAMYHQHRRGDVRVVRGA